MSIRTCRVRKWVWNLFRLVLGSDPNECIDWIGAGGLVELLFPQLCSMDEVQADHMQRTNARRQRRGGPEVLDRQRR